MKKPLAYMLLIISIAMLYSISLGHNFLFDEENIILRNPYLKDLSNIPQIFQTGFFYLGGQGAAPFLEYYRPLSVLSFMLDYHFWQSDPMGYNLTSVLLHILLALAFFQFLCMTIKNVPAAFLAALLFAVHPIHTEAVNHVSCRSETLGALFLVSALIFYLKKWPVWVALFQLAAFLSKESSVLFPAFLFVADVMFLDGRFSSRIKRIAPFVLLSVGYVAYRMWLCPVPMHIQPEALMPKLDRALTMAPAFLKYMRTLFWPPYFQLFGSIGFAKAFFSMQSIVTMVLYAMVLWAILDAAKRRAISLMGLTLFCLGFAPYLQMVAFFPQWAEHYLTVPSLGFFFLCAIILRSVFYIPDKNRRVMLLVLPCVWALLLGYRTSERNALYNDLNKYYSVLSLSDSPYAVHGLHGLAKIRLANNDVAGAKKYLEEALSKDLNQDVTHVFLGWCEANEGHYQSSLEHFDQAIAINPDAMSYQKDRANILMSLGRYADAAIAYAALIIRLPSDYTLYRAAIAAYELDGRPDRSLELGQAALKVFQGHAFESALLHQSLVRLCYRQGWEGPLKDNMDRLLSDHMNVPWQGKVAQLLAGRISEEVFKRDVLPRFNGFEEEAETLFLMSYVLTKNKTGLISCLEANQDLFEKKAAHDPLFAKEWQVAKSAASGSDA